MADPGKSHGGVGVGHQRQLAPLRRTEGQIRSLQQMIEAGRDYEDIAHQIDVVVAGLRRVQADMLRAHLEACAKAALSGELPEAERRRLAEEVGKLVARLN